MVSKTIFTVLAVAALAADASAARFRHQKKAVTYTTRYTTVTDWATVTIYDDDVATTTATTPTTTNSNGGGTTSTPTSTPPPSGGGVQKRGLAYNDPALLPPFVNTGSKVSWAYNWGQTNANMKVNLEFVPMLWSPSAGHTNTWKNNADKAIAAGAKNLLSFNEPDNAGQANISPATAKDEHIKWMNPYAGKARIGAPAITNSGAADQGIGWLQGWVNACAGKCAFDFVPIHWYAYPSASSFLNHLLKVHAVVPDKPIWITEFASTGVTDQNQINTFLQTIMTQMDTNATFSFVERYSYFMVSPGRLIVTGGTTISPLGQTFGYS